VSAGECGTEELAAALFGHTWVRRQIAKMVNGDRTRATDSPPAIRLRPNRGRRQSRDDAQSATPFLQLTRRAVPVGTDKKSFEETSDD
jgi:hypothetical protein